MAANLDGEEYLKHVYRKLQVAVGVAVIKSRPKNISLEDYIASLKSSLLRQEASIECGNDVDNEKNLQDDSEISKQQEELFDKLWAVVPSNTSFNSTEDFAVIDKEIDMSMIIAEEVLMSIVNSQLCEPLLTPLTISFVDVSQDLFFSEDNSKNTAHNCDSVDDDADANIRFIEAVVRLKFIISSHSTIPAHKFKDVLELFLSPEELGQNNSAAMRKRDNWSNESISCCALGYVMRSSETNKLLCVSLERVLAYLGQSVNVSLWDGDDENSLLAHAVRTVRQLLDFASAGSDNLVYCQNACLRFSTGLVDCIRNVRDMNKAGIWERHCTLILQLCKTRYLRDKLIFYTIETIMRMSQDFKDGLEKVENSSNGCSCGPSFEPHTLESSWYLLYILKNLLTFKNEADQRDNGSPVPINVTNEQSSDTCRIRDLWRLSWKGSDSVTGAGDSLRQFYAEQDSIKSSIVIKWKEQLNHYIKSLSYHYPLYTYQLYECEQLL